MNRTITTIVLYWLRFIRVLFSPRTFTLHEQKGMSACEEELCEHNYKIRGRKADGEHKGTVTGGKMGDARVAARCL
jgi:hypothetical protein